MNSKILLAPIFALSISFFLSCGPTKKENSSNNKMDSLKIFLGEVEKELTQQEKTDTELLLAAQSFLNSNQSDYWLGIEVMKKIRLRTYLVNENGKILTARNAEGLDSAAMYAQVKELEEKQRVISSNDSRIGKEFKIYYGESDLFKKLKKINSDSLLFKENR